MTLPAFESGVVTRGSARRCAATTERCLLLVRLLSLSTFANPKQTMDDTGGGKTAPDPTPGSSHTETTQPQSAGGKVYGKELRCMMYGFGDDRNPYTESVELLEDLVFKYINDTTRKAMDVGRTGKITVEDIMYLIRKDKRKCGRIRELLLMNEELKKSRKAFDIEILATQNK